MGVVGRILLELACELQRSDVKAWRLMQFEARIQQPCDHADTIADVQLSANYAPVESIGDLERHQVRGDAGYVLFNPEPEDGVGFARMLLFIVAT